MQMTQADIQDAVATAMIGTEVNSADAWSTLYTRQAPARPQNAFRENPLLASTPNWGWNGDTLVPNAN